MMSAVLLTHGQSVAPVSGNVLSDDKIGGLSDHGSHEFALGQMLVIRLTLSNNSSTAVLPTSIRIQDLERPLHAPLPRRKAARCQS